MDIIEKIGILCGDIEDESLIYGDYVSNRLIDKTYELLSIVSTSADAIKIAVEKQLQGLLPKTSKYLKVWLYSAILNLRYRIEIIEEFQEYILQENGFIANIKYFLYYQIKRQIFVQAGLENTNIRYLQWKLLEQAVEMFKHEMLDLLAPIPEEECDKNMVFVITEQVLGAGHGPTKIVLERCRILIEKMHKKTLLINTAEVMTAMGAIPYYGASLGNYCKEYSEKEIIEWKGTAIPYFQCERNMPNKQAIRLLLQMIRNKKPGLVISVGGSSMLCNLVDDIVPVLNIGLSSAIQETMVTCQVSSQPLRNCDKELLARVGFSEDSVIESMVTFRPLPQTTAVTRTELGLPEDKFVLLIVGSRLDIEMDEAFMDMLNRSVDGDMVVAVIGQFQFCESYAMKFSKLRDKIHCLGYTDNFLAWIEVCDLFVNPHRKGGGTSGLEALFKGLPVVTTPYGDVAVNVGEDFWTESYETMPDLIQKYKNDIVFYKEMKVKARERIDGLPDVAEDFQYTIKVFEQRKQLFK